MKFKSVCCVLFAILLLFNEAHAVDYDLDYLATSTEEVNDSKEVVKPKPTDSELKAYIQRSEEKLLAIQKKSESSETPLSDGDFSENLKQLLDLDEIAKEIKNISLTANEYLKFEYEDATIKPILNRLRRAGGGGAHIFGSAQVQMDLNVEKLNEIFNSDNIQSFDDSEELYSQQYVLEKGLIRDSENVEELKHYWEQIVEKFDGENTDEYLYEVVSLLRGTADEVELSLPELLYDGYSKDLMKNMNDVIKKLTPFYQKLHAYVRSKLFKKYGAGIIKPNGPIPIHLYEKLKQQHWHLDEYFASDFSKSKFPNFDKLFDKQNIKVDNLTEIAENFYQSIGFEHLNEEFWKQNIITAADECSGFEEEGELGFVNDRIKNATLTNCKNGRVNFNAFAKYHKYFGELHNALLKKEQPIYFFSNYYLGSAVGSAVGLSAKSMKHLNAIGILEDLENQSDETLLIQNLYEALETLNQLFSAYARAKLLIAYQDGSISDSNLNHKYWQLLEKYMGVEPPIDRPREVKDIPYEYYIKLNINEDLVQPVVSEILGYQFYLALCQKIGYTGPLRDCDFYNNTAVGPILRDMLKQGSSKSFSEVVATLLPEEGKLDANGILTYFEPVDKWLTQHIKSKNLTVGWVPSTKKLSWDKYGSNVAFKRFINEASKKIYKLYEQIADDSFNNQDKADVFNQENQNVFWKISNSAVAAEELKEIAHTAKDILTNKSRKLFKEVKRQIQKLAKIGDLFVLGDELPEFLKSKQSVAGIGTTKNIPIYPDDGSSNETLSYFPDIKNIFINSADKDELEYYWETWRETNADWAKEQIDTMLDSFQKAADIMGLSLNEFWFRNYDPDFVNQMEQVISELNPLYMKLYQYIRTRLVERYGISESYPIPHHLYQQVLLQAWTNNSVIEAVFPAKNLPPNEEFIVKKGYDAKQILKVADEFYTSLGFESLDDDFWQNRLKPQDADQKNACTASIYDMTPKVYMRYCEKVDFRKFLQAHGYMGRLHYAVEKRKLPAQYFDSYFLEYPVGEAIILSASSPKHLQSLGMEFEFTDDVRMNRLMRMGIHTLFNIHMHFVHTKVISDHLSGVIDKEDIVKHYWKLMIAFAGVEPPSNRKQDNFDFPYEFYKDLEQNHQVKKFVSEVLGYQFYAALCELSEHKGDLNDCDIFGSKKAGDSLKNMMRLGSKYTWQKVLKSILPDEQYLSGSAILKYYQPLHDWLEKANTETDYGFGETDKKFLRPENFLEEEDE